MRKLFLLPVVCLLFFCTTCWSQTLPSGFSTSTIGSGWAMPLGTAITNDGQKLFVWEKDGRVFVCNRNAAGNYIKQTNAVLNITEEVANWGDHGLLGFALDPNFDNNGLIYLLYVVDRHYLMNFGTPNYNPASSQTGATIGRVTRYKTITSGGNLEADLSTRVILLGETRSTGIAELHDSHSVGCLAFAADGSLLVSAGDGGSYYLVDKGSDTDTDFQQALIDGIIRPEENVGAFRAQILNSHNGKLLRIDPVTGNGVSSNPFYSTAAPRSPKSRVWTLGLRNPFRFSIKAGTGSTNPAAGDVGEIYIGDVGWNNYEEVNVITTAGVNCGWPLFEGLTPVTGYTNAITANRDEPNPLNGTGGCTQPFFNFQDLIKQATADNIKTIYNPCNPSAPISTGNRFYHHRPIIDWKHFTNEARVGIFSGNTAATAVIGTPQSNVIGTPFPGNCAIGGSWYAGTNYPVAYNNKYFVADHDAGWIRCFNVDFTDVVTEVKNFGSGFLGTVSLTMNPLDGTLIVVELGNFSTILPAIKQIKFGGNQSPIVKMTSDKINGPSVLNVNFSGINSSDADGSIASYNWNFGDGGSSNLTNPSHNFTAPANTPTKYVVKLTVTDNQGASSVDSIIISVNNTPPVVNITSPVNNSTYKIGTDTLYACTATVTDAEHSSGQLKYEWQTFLRHNSHAHPEPISTAVSTSTNISRIGCTGDDYYWFIKLTVTDAAGLSTVDSSRLFPDCNQGPDNTPPTVGTVSPVNGATGVSTGGIVTAIFNEAIDASTVTGTTFQLKNASNNIISSSVNTSSNQIILTPSAALAGSTLYTVSIKAGESGVKDLAGNALINDYNWTFTTAAVDNTAPSVTSVSPVNGATGVGTGTTAIANFSEAINGATVNGTTFQLKDAGNNIIPATINTSSNQITLIPSAALAGSAAYTATIKGGISGVEDLAGNELVNDYSWTFTTASGDNAPPIVSSVLPINGATGVSINTTVTANFNEAVNGSTITAATFQLRDQGNNLIPAAINILSSQIILTPSAPLANSATYTATIKAGSSGVKDLAGNALVNDYSWTFTTMADNGGTSYTVFQPNAFPQELLANDGQGIEVGMKFQAIQDGFITGIRYFKDEDATGIHTGHLWSRTGALLASVVFTGETASGWQQAFFSSPVAITAGITYIASYFSPSGDYASTDLYFSQAVVNGPLRGLANGEDGPNGLYKYSSTSVFPNSSYQSSNYWVDVVFTTNGTAVPTVTTQPSSQTVCSGINVSFTSAATGDTPAVQWQVSANGTTWTNISGSTNSVLTFAAAIADNNKQYRAVWTNSGGSVNSNPATLTVNAIPGSPTVTVVNNCGNSILTAGSFTGALLWSNGATSSSITVTTAGAFTVTQTVNGCTSAAGTGVAAPKTIPVLSSNLTAAVTTGTAFNYTPASVTPGTAFTWTRATVTGISNAAAGGTGTISETLVNTTSSPVIVTYAYTLTANGCTNTQNLVVTVNTTQAVNCVINSSITSSFNATAIPAGRYIWFNSSFDPGSLGTNNGPVTINVSNSRITFTANSVQYVLNVPDARIRLDATVKSASTQFINNVWVTAVPRSFSTYIFMSGLSYQVPVNLPGGITNVVWTATISIDKAGISLSRRWGAAVYTSFAANAGVNVKPVVGTVQNPYPNTNAPGTPENFKPFVVAGAKGAGGTSYTGLFASGGITTCIVNPGQRSSGGSLTNKSALLPFEPESKLEVSAMPNPSNTFFNLVIKGNGENPVTVRVYDILGQVTESHERISSRSTLAIGRKWTSGTYFVEVIQNGRRKFVKVIKVN